MKGAPHLDSPSPGSTPVARLGALGILLLIMLNMQYLDDDDPKLRLSKEVTDFPQDFTQVCWDPALYATFEMPQAYSTQLPTLIDRVAQQYFALQPECEMQYTVEYQGE
jgi:hypothetical protein